MAFLKRGDIDLYYEVHGSGPAILLTPGYSATTQMWAPNIDALAARHTLILWDVRGHGRSGAPTDPALYSRDKTMHDMAALLDHLQLEQAVIGGLSLGGYLSLAFNVFHPDRVRGLLIFDTGPGYRNDEAREGWNRMAIESGEKHASTGLRLAARGILTQQDSKVLDAMPGIAVPTLVLAGANDTPFLKATDYMAAKIPGARKVIIDNAGHTANLDQPDAFNRVVTQFLADHSL
jgi:pimeloyl-ACP methyl ester carboxylesterase